MAQLRTPRERITQVIEKWLLVEPLLLAVWTTHALIPNLRIRTIRVERGRIEYNPHFIEKLTSPQLEATLRFETLRILLKHPYLRRQPQPALSYAASNLTVQEYLQTELPFPRARDVFFTQDYDRQYFEFYYQKLLEIPPQSPTPNGSEGSLPQNPGDLDPIDGQSPVRDHQVLSPPRPQNASSSDLLAIYIDPLQSGEENANQWDQDDLLSERLDDVVKTARDTQSWGSISGQLRDHILANLRPKLDYRSVLRKFRTSILSQHRKLTRMKPNRRYGFIYLGSRREFTTRLLVAVDVSGSMNQEQIREGFSVINRFFNYGIPEIDVLQFDSEITIFPITLKRAKREITLKGRGGTNFAPVLAYIDENPQYDGLIIYTDGYAPCPALPRNRRTRILWLFVHETHYCTCYPTLKSLGQGIYLKPDTRL